LIVGKWLAAGLLLASIPALAASTLSIDDVAGVYKRRHEIAMHAEPASREQAENILEVVKVSPREAYVRVRLIFDNGHLCSLYGIANVEGSALVYRKPDTISVFAGRGKPFRSVETECILSLKRDGNRLVFDDKDDVCRASMCGARGILRKASFDLKSRRVIRYMPRLLASREYAEAMRDAQQRRKP
jgi:hypothetical protein